MRNGESSVGWKADQDSHHQHGLAAVRVELKAAVWEVGADAPSVVLGKDGLGANAEGVGV
jgi:hypothetical protein